MQKYKSILFVIALVVLCIPAVFALLQPGFFDTDDGGWMIIRFAAFYNSLIDMQLPVRFLGGINFGYGYPVSNFLYPGFMYLAAPFHLIGFGFVESVKIILVLSMVGSGVATFLWLRRIVDQAAAFIGALFYVYLPYHLYDVYQRGSVGEVLALFFAPLVFYFVERKSLALTAFSIFFLILSHNTLALFFLPIIFIYIIVRKSSVKQLLASVLYGFAMTAFFTIPALYELSLTKFSSIKISNPLDYFATIELVGIASLVAILGSIFVLLVKYRAKLRGAPCSEIFMLFLLIASFSIFLSLPMSAFIWREIPSSLVQFPFRLLSLLLLSIAFVSAYGVFLLRGVMKISFALILCVVLVFSAYSYLSPKTTNTFPDEYYATNLATTTVQNEYMPVWVKEEPTTLAEQKVEYVKGSGQIQPGVNKSNKLSFTATGEPNSVIRINTIYYPGWRAYVNNMPAEISYDNQKGVMEIIVERETSNVMLSFQETPIRIISDAVTIILMLGALLYAMRSILKFR